MNETNILDLCQTIVFYGQLRLLRPNMTVELKYYTN